VSYKGKITTTGTSEAIRLEKDLFRQHLEFKQAAEVKADVIAPGKMLISVIETLESDNGEDPVIGAFLAFLEKDMSTTPGSITELNDDTIARAKRLTTGVMVDDDELE
jgi:antitoxin PrlF